MGVKIVFVLIIVSGAGAVSIDNDDETFNEEFTTLRHILWYKIKNE